MLIFHVVCFYFITTLKYIPVNILVVTLVCQARTANVPSPDKEEITTKRPSGKLLQISILMMAKYVYTNLLIFCSLEFHMLLLGNPCNSFVMSLMDIFIFRTKFLCHHRHHLILMVFGLEIPQKLYIILEQMSGLPTVLMTFQSDKQDTETKKG